MEHTAIPILAAVVAAALGAASCGVVRADRAMTRPGTPTATAHCCRGSALAPTDCVALEGAETCDEAPVQCRDYVRCDPDVAMCVCCIGYGDDANPTSSACGPGSGPPTWNLDAATD